MYCTACYRVNSHFYITCFLANWLLAGKVKYMAAYILKQWTNCTGGTSGKHCRTLADIYNFCLCQKTQNQKFTKFLKTDIVRALFFFLPYLVSIRVVSLEKYEISSILAELGRTVRGFLAATSIQRYIRFSIVFLPNLLSWFEENKILEG